jgi:hypothetical protein
MKLFKMNLFGIKHKNMYAIQKNNIEFDLTFSSESGQVLPISSL